MTALYLCRSLKNTIIHKFIIAIEFIDYDLKTAFGAPWEMLLQNSYLIVKKGGLVGGYGGFVSFVPELQLSKYICTTTLQPTYCPLICYTWGWAILQYYHEFVILT